MSRATFWGRPGTASSSSRLAARKRSGEPKCWRMLRSVLDDLPGVGPARKRSILQHFGSPERFLSASRDELESVPGLPQKVARDIHAYVNKIR